MFLELFIKWRLAMKLVMIFGSLHSNENFAVYTGPALSVGSRYQYIVLAEDIYSGGSHAVEEFVYESLTP